MTYVPPSSGAELQTNPARPKAVLYAHRCGQAARPGLIVEQLMICRDAATRAGYDIAGEYFDLARSGKTLAASGASLNALKAKIEEGDVQAVFGQDVAPLGRGVENAALDESQHRWTLPALAAVSS